MALVSPTEEQYELLQKKLKERIEKGRGETIYDVGIGDGNIYYNYFIVCNFYCTLVTANTL